MIDIRSPLARLAVSFRAIGLLALAGAAVGLTIGLATIRGSLEPFFTANQIGPSARRFMLLFTFGGAAASAAGGMWFLVRGRDRVDAAGILNDFARRLCPVGLCFFPILLFRRQVWLGKDLAFLTMVALFVLGAWAATRTAMQAPAFRWELRVAARARGTLERYRARFDPRRRAKAHLPLVLLCAGVLLSIVCHAAQTLRTHASVRSGPELALADHLVWNVLHGGSFFRSSLLSGAGGLTAPADAHASFVAYALAPLYAPYQHAGWLLVLQSILVAAAALPLYVLTRRHVSAIVAAIVALAYLLYPALRAESSSGFQFLSLGPIVLWSAWALLAAGRDRWAAVFVALTLAVREDTVLWVFVLGAYFILSGRRPWAGLLLGAIGAVWLGVLKVLVLPRLGGMDSFLGLYGGLIPPGKHGVGHALATVLDNPGLVASTIADMPRLIYLLQILLPLGLLPLRSSLWLLFVIPGFLQTLLPADTGAIRSLGSPLGAHWIVFMFPAVALGIEAMQRRAPSGAKPQVVALVGLLCAMVPISYQFGSDIPPRAVPINSNPHPIAVDDDGRRRHDAAHDLLRSLPPRAKVACSHFTAAALSNRPDISLLTAGVSDAEYIFFPTQVAELVDNERAVVTGALRGGGFGVLATHEPFALAKRGHSPAGNAVVLARW